MADIPPNQTIYVQNLYEKLPKEGVDQRTADQAKANSKQQRQQQQLLLLADATLLHHR
jgi:hypothetical protein